MICHNRFFFVFVFFFFLIKIKHKTHAGSKLPVPHGLFGRISFVSIENSERPPKKGCLFKVNEQSV